MPGDLVHYKGAAGEIENGVVKGVPSNNLEIAHVVYKCDDQWHRFRDYTGQATNVSDLEKGWHNGEYRLHYCDECEHPTIQKSTLINPDTPDHGNAWECTKCHELLAFAPAPRPIFYGG